LSAILTHMGTQIEINNFANILAAIEAAYLAARSGGAKRIITTIRIDVRLDKSVSLQKKIDSVMEKL